MDREHKYPFDISAVKSERLLLVTTLLCSLTDIAQKVEQARNLLVKVLIESADTDVLSELSPDEQEIFEEYESHLSDD